jgi:outer membrane protein assembly factor BamB
VAGFFAVNAALACGPVNRLGPDRQDPGWPTYLGGARHDAAAAERLNPEPRPLWVTDVGRAIRGSPALGETVIVVGVAERQVVLLDRASGEQIWRQRVDGTVLAGPLLDGDRVYVATERTPEGKVYALRLRDGGRLWTRSTGSVAAPLAVDGDALYAGNEAGEVFRLGLDGGTVAWRRALPGAVRAGPVPAASGILVATTADSLFLLDRGTGVIVHRAATTGSVLGTPARSGDRVFLGTTAGQLLVVTLPELTVGWTLDLGDAIYGAPALAGDTLFAVTRGGELWVVPLDAPHSARAHRLDIAAVAGPTATASGVLVASVSGEVLLVDAASGNILWRAQVEAPVEQPPLVLDRQVVVAGGRGAIHTYR